MTEPDPIQRPVLGTVATVVAVLLILVFLAMIGMLMAMRSDRNWDRLVYLLTGLEALVFSGAGALFGTTVQRANVAAARKDATEARARADLAQQEGAAGRALSTAVLARADALRAGDRRLGGRPDPDEDTTPPAGPGRDLADLAAIARSLFPPDGHA